MFRLSVAQYPTIAVNAGKKKRRNSCVLANRLGAARMGPSPCALCSMNASNINDSSAMKGAEKLCRKRIDSTPRQTMYMFNSQNPKKQSHVTHPVDAVPGTSTCTI